jgi:hypothetical protein
MSKTLKQIISEMSEHPMSTFGHPWEFDEYLLNNVIGQRDSELFYQHIYLDDNYEYSAQLDYDDNGVIFADIYLCKEISAYSRELHEAEMRLPEREFIKYSIEHEYPEAKFRFEVPLERGFSDTPKKADTRFCYLDIRIAVDDKLSEMLGKSKLQPWELKSAIIASGMANDFPDGELDEIVDIIAA